jgi:hypothetical protein
VGRCICIMRVNELGASSLLLMGMGSMLYYQIEPMIDRKKRILRPKTKSGGGGADDEVLHIHTTHTICDIFSIYNILSHRAQGAESRGSSGCVR